MNFIDFLNQSNNIKRLSNEDTSKQQVVHKNNKNKNKEINHDNLKNKIDNKNIDKFKNKLNSDNIFDNNVSTKTENLNSINHLKIGTFVKIIHYKNSLYNVYKGYIGEIKDFKQNSNTAVINLHAINENRSIILPIDHFIIYDYNS